MSCQHHHGALANDADTDMTREIPSLHDASRLTGTLQPHVHFCRPQSVGTPSDELHSAGSVASAHVRGCSAHLASLLLVALAAQAYDMRFSDALLPVGLRDCPAAHPAAVHDSCARCQTRQRSCC